MDASVLSGQVKALNEANASSKTEDVLRILRELKEGATPSEELLRTTKAGVAIGKLRNNPNPEVSASAKEVVKVWREAVDEQKKKRKREDGEDGDAKKVKTEEKGSSAASPAAASPTKDSKPRIKSEGSAERVEQRQPLSTIDSTRKVPRTAKLDGMDGKLKADQEDGGDDMRDKCVVMMYDALAVDSTAEKRTIGERAKDIERAAFNLLNGSTGNDYRAKMRSLFLNLKDKGNPGLRNEIVLGFINGERLVNMSKEDMASESVRALNEKIASDNLFKAKAVGETQAETDAFKCGRCQQRKCTYYQMQTRSADEPMTTFVSCTNCGNRWKFS